jgi:hypothetical protein
MPCQACATVVVVPRKRPDRLHADKACDHHRCRAECRTRAITPRRARGRVDSSERRGRHRRVVERTLAWLMSGAPTSPKLSSSSAAPSSASTRAEGFVRYSKRPRMTKPEPARYRTTSWKSYNAALRRRGSLLIWLDKDMEWIAPKAGRPGRPPIFSDAAIQFCLMTEVLFGLPLRQSTGMVASILEMAGLDWPVPDFSTAQAAGRRRLSFR